MINVVQIGCGKMAKYTMRYVFEKGSKIVGAFDMDPNLIGKDIGQVIEGEDKKVLIEDVSKLEDFLVKNKPDIAIIATMTFLNDISDVLRVCAKNGVNVSTISEEAFFASNSNPNLFKEIDVLAKANNCTISGVGYQDFAWGNLVAVLAGGSHKITKIKGKSSYNLEDYGMAPANAHGAGFTPEQFEKEIASIDNISNEERRRLIENREFSPSFMWNTVGWIADRLGLKIKSINQKCIPLLAEEDLYSETLGMTIPKGNATGMSAIVSAECSEGIRIEAECIGKVYTAEEFDVNEWSVFGEPDTTITINHPATIELTCANAVNRIPDIIKAPAGFISTSTMDIATYKVKSLDE